MNKHEILDKLKLAAFVLMLFGIPLTLAVLGGGSSGDQYDHIRR